VRSEVERFISQMTEMAELSSKERDQLAADTLVAAALPGTVVIYRGESSDAAYFILKGRAAAGYPQDDDYVILNYLYEGDFFGEVAALTGAQRTANVITEEESEFLIIPSKVMKRLAKEYEGPRRVFYAKMAERLNRIELVRSASLDQQLLLELRTNPTVMEYERSRADA